MGSFSTPQAWIQIDFLGVAENVTAFTNTESETIKVHRLIYVEEVEEDSEERNVATVMHAC